MSLNESIVEDAALEWFLLRQGYGGQVGEQTRCARTLIPAFSQREKEKERQVIRRPAGAGPALNASGAESRLEAVR